jgi:hypothetical protein
MPITDIHGVSPARMPPRPATSRSGAAHHSRTVQVLRIDRDRTEVAGRERLPEPFAEMRGFPKCVRSPSHLGRGEDDIRTNLSARDQDERRLLEQLGRDRS